MTELPPDSGPVRLELGPAQWSDYFLEHWVAPGYSSFTLRDLPDLSRTEPRWINRFIMNSTFRVSVADPQRGLLLNLCRRTESAFDEYAHANEALGELERTSRSTISPYFRAVRHLEAVISNLDIGWALFGAVQGEKLFSRGDGSRLARLRKLHNASKHADEHLQDGRAPKPSTLVVWVSNKAILAHDVELTHAEVAELMRLLAEAADQAVGLSA